MVIHILVECRLYDKERMDLKLIKTLYSTLGPNPDQNIKFLKFLKTIDLINNI